MRKSIVPRLLVGLLSALVLVAGLNLSHPLQAQAADNNKTAWDFFVGKGFSKTQTAGLIGNFVVESGRDPINPAAVQYGGGPGRGIAQWEGSRRTALFNYANARGVAWSNLQVQLDFVWHEFTTTEKNAYNKLKATTSVSAAAVAVRQYYERPSVHADQARINAANSIYSRYSGGTTPPPNTVPTLQIGSTGARVTNLQKTMNTWFPSYAATPLATDGVFGAKTDSAVKEFQRRTGLVVDGKFGPATRSKFAAVTGVWI